MNLEKIKADAEAASHQGGIGCASLMGSILSIPTT